MCIRDRVYTVLRTAYSSALINGPFSILVGSKHGLLAPNDRLKLRSLITAEKGNKTYFASEDSAKMCIRDRHHIRVIVDDVGNFGETLSCNIIFRDEVNDVCLLYTSRCV